MAGYPANRNRISGTSLILFVTCHSVASTIFAENSLVMLVFGLVLKHGNEVLGLVTLVLVNDTGKYPW